MLGSTGKDQISPDEKKKALGKGLDPVIREKDLSDIGITDDSSLTDKTSKLTTLSNGRTLTEGLIKDPDTIEVDWTKEKNIPIHELVVKSPKRSPKKKN